MPNWTPEISGASIVLTGSFNPTIFQPEWFGRQQLLPEAEISSAEIKIVMPQVCHFETERFIVYVMQDRFSASTKPNATSEPLRDLVLGTFFVLEHTPITALGLNRQMHFALKSEETWHKLGDRLAPKDGWNEILEGRPGLLSLEILTNRKHPEGSRVQVKVQPSVTLKFGAYVETNEHYPAGKDQALKGLMEILKHNWEEAQKYAGKVADHILTWAIDS